LQNSSLNVRISATQGYSKSHHRKKILIFLELFRLDSAARMVAASNYA
jgi:hypothetical protein